MDAQKIEQTYRFESKLVANVLKKQAMHSIKQMCREITTPYAPPYTQSATYKLIKKELKLSLFEDLLPKISEYTDEALLKWRNETNQILSEAESYAQKVLSAYFTQFPESREKLIEDMEFSRKKFEERKKKVYMVLGGVGAVSLIGTIILAVKN